ncbi:hypothetical protein VA7868_00185 [Vibrio aerogenes CECT 7868]|uniref:Uncharacterized protein n=1 Tax=Vibrio aerogenes CECT 7868 TaxID=1216006 RepID=A0A1M5UV92_9VIBR|nr:hypothetical protein VA7868_00185 [Vibrio aerogenes CECT 7868]
MVWAVVINQFFQDFDDCVDGFRPGGKIHPQGRKGIQVNVLFCCLMNTASSSAGTGRLIW